MGKDIQRNFFDFVLGDELSEVRLASKREAKELFRGAVGSMPVDVSRLYIGLFLWYRNNRSQMDCYVSYEFGKLLNDLGGAVKVGIADITLFLERVLSGSAYEGWLDCWFASYYTDKCPGCGGYGFSLLSGEDCPTCKSVGWLFVSGAAVGRVDAVFAHFGIGDYGNE